MEKIRRNKTSMKRKKRNRSRHSTTLTGRRMKKRQNKANLSQNPSPIYRTTRKVSVFSRAVSNAAALAKRALAGAKSEVKAPDRDYMSIIDEKVFSCECSVREQIIWRNYYFVFSDRYVFQFTDEPLISLEVEEYLVSAIPLDTIEEIRVEGKVVTLFLGTRAQDVKEKVVTAIDTGQFELIKRHVSLTKRLKLTIKLKNKNEASLFAKKLYSMSIHHTTPLEDVKELSLKVGKNKQKIGTLTNLCVHRVGTIPVYPELKPLKIKYLFGGIPLNDTGFKICVTFNNDEGPVTTKRIFAKDILDLEVDVIDKSLGNKSRNLLNQQVNISVPLSSDYHLILKLERDLLGYNSYLGSQNIFKRQFHYLLFQIFKLIHSMEDKERILAQYLLVAFDVFIWLLILYITSSFSIAFVTGVSLYWSFRIQAPLIERELLNRFQPYYISHILVKTFDDFDLNYTERKPNKSITIQEYSLIEQVRERVLENMLFDELDNDSYSYQVIQKHILEDFRLVPYIRARNNNVKKAVAMCQKATEWRIEYESDKLAEQRNIPLWLLKYMSCPAFVRRYENPELEPDTVWLRDCKFNNYATILKAGGLKNKQVLNKLENDLELAFHYLVWAGEYIKQDCDKLHIESEGAIPYGLTVVIDMSKFRINDNPSVTRLFAIAKQFLPTLVLINPDLLYRVLIINTPTVFFSIWKMVKPLIPAKILQRFELRRYANPDKTYAYISNYLADEQIPAFYGGSMVIDDDELCSDRIMGNGAIDMESARYILKPKKKPKVEV